MNREYYVYEWYNIDTGYIFYVGAGKGKRYKTTNGRNNRFKDYINNNNCDSRIIKDNLTREESFSLEHKTIIKYRKLDYCSCNFDDGGHYMAVMHGEANPMYGGTHSPEVRKKISEILSDGRYKGKNNPQYGISPKERMDEETYKGWIEKHKLNFFGENNPNYGNDTLHKKYLNDPEYAKEKQSRPAEQNGRATPVKMYDSDMSLICEFTYIGKCAEYLIKNNLVRSKEIDSVRSYISKSNKLNKTYYNYYFKY